ncbi:elongation factor Ts [Hwanghaeella grinnelliae]|uniref:Elongation factor Ts n=1 Tax=Hwanghaeella grinnelliae TaxID=2500179 RepID=A0A437QXX3_9PROT|nr:translation elongation factor Ts [Hwanghaeella grinnelliae]RVU39319.1 elongation factor Ts [Hwanghaeella grinnelliae]
MAAITAALVKELRDKSGAGMMDCKKALAETDGDMDAAVDWLRTKGLAAAQKKSGRVAADGLVAVVTSGTKGAAVEINAETDFVARNENFQEFVSTIAGIALEVGGESSAIEGAAYPGTGRTVAEQLTHNIATIGENMSFRRAKVLEVSQGLVASYMHGALVPGLGKIGVLVALESSASADVLEALGKQIAMHIAAARPEFLAISDVDQGALDREKAVLTEQARESGKPEEIIEKMVQGRLRKYYEEVVLTEQVFVIDNETKISKVVENAAKEAGTDIKLTGFVRFELGEGIEKEETDFAAEVAQAVKG